MNEDKFLTNDDVLNQIEGDFHVCCGVDSRDATDEQERLNFPTEFLNT